MIETYQYRLRRYELAASRARWFGAAIAAAIAYLVGGMVDDNFAQTAMTVAIVVSGTTLGMHMFMFENSAFQLRGLLDSQLIDPQDPVDETVSPYPIGASILRRLTFNAICQIGVLVVVERLWHTFIELPAPLEQSLMPTLWIAYFVGVFAVLTIDLFAHAWSLLRARRT